MTEAKFIPLVEIIGAGKVEITGFKKVKAKDDDPQLCYELHFDTPMDNDAGRAVVIISRERAVALGLLEADHPLAAASN